MYMNLEAVGAVMIMIITFITDMHSKVCLVYSISRLLLNAEIVWKAVKSKQVIR